MATVTLVFLCVFAFVGVRAIDEGTFYDEKFLHLDIKAIIDNNRLFNKYTKCIIENSTKNCPKMALQMRTILPEVMETACAKCSKAHIEKAREAANYVCQKRPDAFLSVTKKVDPTGEIRKRIEEKHGHALECDKLHN